MSLHRHSPSLIEQGWIRALVLLVLYIAMSSVWGSFVWSTELWFTLSSVLSVLLVYLFRKFIDKRSFESLGFDISYFYPDSLIGFTLGSFLVFAGALLMYYMNSIRWTEVIVSFGDLLFNFTLLAMIAVSEEVLFRGYVLRNLMKSFNKWIAVFISALLFSIVHYSNTGIPPVGMLNTFLGGLVLGLSFVITKALWLPIFFHLSWNFIQGPVLGFRVSGLSFESLLSIETTGAAIISGGAYGFEGSVVCTILFLFAVAAGSYIESQKSYE